MLPKYAFIVLLVVGALTPSSAVAQVQPAKQPAAAPPAAAPSYRYWTTDWSLDDVDIGDLVIKLRTIGIQLPLELKGRATVDFRVSVPLNALRTGRAYRINGSLVVRDLVADRLRFDLVRADVVLKDGQLLLNQLRCIEQIDREASKRATADNAGKPVQDRATENSGTVVGTATAQLIPQGDFKADLKTRNLPLGPIAKLLARFGFSDGHDTVAGSLTTDLALSGRVDEIRQPQRWKIAGDFTASGLRRGDEDGFDLATTGFRWAENQLDVSELRIDSDQRPGFFVAASGKVRFDNSTAFELDVSANDIPLPDVAFLLSPDAQSLVVGKLDAKGSASGTIGPTNSIEAMDVQIAVASPRVVVAGLQLGLLEHDLKLTTEHCSLAPRGQGTNKSDWATSNLVIESLDFDYAITEQAATLNNLAAKLFGGEIKGRADFARNPQLEHRLDLSWTAIDPVFELPFAGIWPPPKVSVQSSGEIQWTVPSGKVMTPTAHRGTAQVNLRQIDLGSQSVGEADITMRVDGETLDASLDGRLFGGKATIKTIAQLDQLTSWIDVPTKLQFTEFQLDGFSMRRLLQHAGIDRPRFDARIGASVTPNLSSSDGSPLGLSGTAKLVVAGLTADGVLVSRSLKLAVRFDGTDLVVESCNGVYAGGQVDIDGTWSVAGGTKLLTARLTRAKGEVFLLPISARASDWAGGIVSGRATIAGFGAGWIDAFRISGSMSTESGTTFGMPIGNAHGPFNVVVSTSPLSWRATFPTMRSNLARGRVSGNLVLQSSGGGRAGVHLDSQWRVNHVDFESLLSSSIGTSTIGRGDLTGDFRLSGRNIRNIKDLEGEWRIRLGGTDATAVPGLSTAGSLLGATSLTGVRFEQGEAIGRISNGRLLLENVSMVSDRVSVQAKGSVGLVDRRMDIGAVISTGNFQGQNVLLANLGTQALLDSVPIGQINQLLSDRTIVVQMVGSAQSPVIRLLAGETLRANAQRFARQRVFGLIVADALWSD